MRMATFHETDNHWADIDQLMAMPAHYLQVVDAVDLPGSSTARLASIATAGSSANSHPASMETDRRFTLLGVPITDITTARAIELLEQMILSGRRQPSRFRRADGGTQSVYFVNAHTLNVGCDDAEYRRVLCRADQVFGDGTGVRWGARLQGIRVRDNLVGTDLVPNLFRATAGRGYSYFLLGADAASIEKAARHAERQFPGWRLAGFHHGYVVDPDVNEAALDAINAAAPDVLLVGMGNPLQEKWIDRHRGRLNVPVSLGVGGLFDHWAGNIQRAPRWLRWLGHEWLGLLVQQPQKARRYLIGNPLFLLRALRERLQSSEPEA